MSELRKFVAPEFVFGVGARRLVARYARNFGARRVLVVTDPGIAAAGWAGEVCDALAAAEIGYALFDAVSPNPRAEEVMAGAEVYRSGGCDVVVAVGGGSVIDCAKGICIVSSNGRHILEFEGIDNVDVPGPPLICVPTTAGTSADISQFAIVTDAEQRVKIAIISKATVPDVALIDPETTKTMGAGLTACTGLDALTHAIEAFVSTASSPIVDLHALEAIRLIPAHLPQAQAAPDDVGLRSKIMQASLQAGLAFSNASLGAVHAMAHSLGGFLDLPHGASNAMLLEHVVAFNYGTAPERFDAIAAAMGVDLRGMTARDRRQALVDALVALKRSLGVVDTLGAAGVRSGDIPDLAAKAVRDACLVTNPRRAGARDIEVVYEEAM